MQDVGTAISGRHVAPRAPTGVNNDAPINGRMRVYWSSSGKFFTEIKWEYLENASWHFAGEQISYGQETYIEDLQPGFTYRYFVRHRNEAGPGPYFDF